MICVSRSIRSFFEGGVMSYGNNLIILLKEGLIGWSSLAAISMQMVPRWIMFGAFLFLETSDARYRSAIETAL